MTDTGIHYLDDCPCGTDHRQVMIDGQKRGKVFVDGEGTTVKITPRWSGKNLGRQEIDAYEILEPILMRPAMYLGSKSITAFGHLYMGIQYLGGCGHGGPFMYKLRNSLWEEGGFSQWAHARHDKPNPLCTWRMYWNLAYAKFGNAAMDDTYEEEGFDLFCADLKAFRNEKKDFVCKVDKCWKKLDKGESFICSRHKGFQTCYYCNKPFDASGPDYPKGIIMTDWCCSPCKEVRHDT